MYKTEAIMPRTAECASPVVIVPKHNGSYCMCMDYRKQDAVSIHDAYPLPRKDKYIDFLGDVVVFPTLDAK